MNRFAILALGSISISSISVIADDSPEPFAAEVELGAIVTSGNTETSTYKGKVDLRQDLSKIRNHFIIEGLYKKDQIEVVTDTETGETEEESRTTAQKYYGSAQTDFKLNDKHRGLFLFASYEDDRFSGYEYRGTLAVGYTDRLFGTQNSHFDYSVGPGASFDKLEECEEDGEVIDCDSEVTGVVRLAFEYIYRLSENAKFSQVVASDLAVESERNSRTRSETALSAKINNSLAMKLSYTINQNTHVPDDKKHADTEAAVTLVYSF